MWVNGKRWFRVAGACIAAGFALMLVALCLVGGNVWRLSSPLPFGISIVKGDGVYLATDRMPEAPSAPEAPEAPTAPAAPAAPSSPASFAAEVVDAWEPPVPQTPGAFDVEDRAALARRAFACLLEALA